MRKIIGNLCMVFGAALVFGALALFLYNQQEAQQAEQASAELMVQLVEELESIEQETLPLEVDIPRELLTEEDLKMTEVVINGHAYIGYLSIPELELELPIMSDWNGRKLQIAPCRYYGSLKGEDLVLMAHNYPKHFGLIKNLSEGDSVFFTDMDGNVTEYEVVGKDILDPYAVEEMTSGEFDLTLFTCTVGGASRVTVWCDFVK